MTEWDRHWTRDYPFWYAAVALYSLQAVTKEVLGIHISVRGDGHNGWLSSYSERGTAEKMNSFIKEQAKKDPEYIKKVREEMQKTGNEFVTYAKNTNPNENIKNLAEQYKKFSDLFCIYCSSLWKTGFLAEAAGELFEEWIKENIPQEKRSDATKELSVPSEKAGVFLLLGYLSKTTETEKCFTFMKQNYPWLGSKDPFLEPMSDEDIDAYIKNIKKNKKEENKKPEQKMSDPITSFYQESLYIKDKRDEYRRQAFYYAHPLAKAIAQQLGMSLEDLSYLLPNEINDANVKEKIKQRKEAYTMTLNGDLNIISGAAAVKKFVKKEEVIKNMSITGKVGCSGYIKGEVQIIRKKDDIKNFKQGCVLVTITTDPQHISAMQKACAFITDEGGITCHAAIVAREMNKPCIVGTKNATKVLKDGDLVEVDANNGTVRKLK